MTVESKQDNLGTTSLPGVFQNTSSRDLLARRDFVLLGEFTSHGATMEFVNRLLGEILPTSDVDGDKPALAPPAPRRNRRDADLREPAVHTDDCRSAV